MAKTTNPTTTVLKSNLQKALGLVGRAVAKSSTLPVLTNVLLSAEGGRLRLSATTLELALTTYIGCKSTGNWATTLPFSTLSDYVAALPDDAVTLECNLSKVTVKFTCQSYTSTFKGLPADEFPALSSVSKPDFSLAGADITTAIKRVIGAAATDEARPILTGILIQSDGGQIVLAASDGFRVAEARLDVPKVPQKLYAIVPAKGLGELHRCMTADAPVDVKLFGPAGKPERIGFRCGDNELVAQLVEGTFPTYQNVIPKSFETHAIVETAHLRQACRVADIIARENAHTARIHVHGASEDKKAQQPGGIEITTVAAETGDHNSFIPGQVNGPDLEIAFNVKFLKEAVDNCDTPNTLIRFVNATSPALIKPATGEDYLIVLMPMHLGR